MVNKSPSRKLRVGVMRGGPSGEYEVSLKTGKNIIDTLRQSDQYEVQDVFLDRSGKWHIGGVHRNVERILPHIDVMVNALHGLYGEDGRVQQLLESHNIPFTGSRSLGSALGMNKPLAKKFFKNNGLLTPEHVVIKKENYSLDGIRKIIVNHPHLRIVKPASSGSSLGVSLISNEAEFEKAITDAFEHSDSVLVEEFIKGKEATCGVVEDSSGDVMSLHPVEVRDLTSKDQSKVWSYDSKYSDHLHELICPGNFSEKDSRLIQEAAKDAHKALGLRHYSRSDFIVNRNGVYILEVNTLPGLTTTSLFPKSLSVAGISMEEFLDHIISLAVNR